MRDMTNELEQALGDIKDLLAQIKPEYVLTHPDSNVEHVLSTPSRDREGVTSAGDISPQQRDRLRVGDPCPVSEHAGICAVGRVDGHRKLFGGRSNTSVVSYMPVLIADRRAINAELKVSFTQVTETLSAARLSPSDFDPVQMDTFTKYGSTDPRLALNQMKLMAASLRKRAPFNG